MCSLVFALPIVERGKNISYLRRNDEVNCKTMKGKIL
jgi:hypothetical protein